MADFFFFTELGKLITQTNESDSFGSIALNTPSTGHSSFNTTSVHTATAAAKAFAITDGEVYVHPHPNGTHATLVLKPHAQASERKRVDIPRVKYFIYRGIDITQLKSADLIAASGLGVDWIDYIHSTSSGNVDFATIQIKVDSGLATATDTPVSYTFFENEDTTNEAPKVYAGDCIGFFLSAGFSVQVVYDTYQYEPTIEDLQTTAPEKHVLSALDVVTATSHAERLLSSNRKDKVLNFMDICAFYGSNYFSVIKCKDNGGVISEVTTLQIYSQILSKFFNKNVTYLDFRNENDQSYNYYRHLDSADNEKMGRFFPQYDEKILVKRSTGSYEVDLFDVWGAGSTLNDYYTNDWPIRKYMLDDIGVATNETEKNVLNIKLPKESESVTNTFNFNQTAVISYGFIDKTKEPKGKKRFIDLEILNTNSHSSRFSIIIPNENSDNFVKPVCWYTRIMYCRRYQTDPKPGDDKVYHYMSTTLHEDLPKRYFTDAIFQPRILNLPKNVSGGLQFKTFDNDVFIDFSFEYQPKQTGFVGKVGIARDANYTTLYVIPSIYRKKAQKNLSDLISDNYGIVNDSSVNFLNYLDEKMLRRSLQYNYIEINSINKIYYEYDTLNIFPGLSGKRLLKKAGPLVFMFENENYDNILQLIEDKIADDQFDPSLDIYLSIKERNDIKVLSDNEEAYMSFHIMVRGFDTSSGVAVPIEFDSGVVLMGKVENGKKNIQNIFVDHEITNLLINESFKAYNCPLILLNNTHSRPYRYEEFDGFYSTITSKIDVFSRLEQMIEKVYKEDFADFITELYDSTVRFVTYTDPSHDKYEIRGNAHNRFLLYREVLSKFILPDTSIPSTTKVYLMEQVDETSSYPPVDGFDKAVMVYDNNIFPDFQTITIPGGTIKRVKLNYNAAGFVAPRSTIIHEGFFIEAIYAFALWKVGKDFELIKKCLKNYLAVHTFYFDINGLVHLEDVDSDLDQLGEYSQLFNNLCLVLDKNQIITPGNLSANIFSMTDADISDILTAFSGLFENTEFYTAQISYPGWKNKLPEYQLEIETFSNLSTNSDEGFLGSVTEDFYMAKKAYLNKYMECLYASMGGNGRQIQFMNLNSGKVQHNTSNLHDSRLGAFLMNLYLVAGKTLEQEDKSGVIIDLGETRKKGELAIVHFGTYGIDDSGSVQHAITNYTKGGLSEASSFGFGDLHYRLYKSDASKKWMNGTDELGYFDTKTGDLVIKDNDITSIKMNFKSGEQLVYNTVSISFVPLSSTYSFSKAFTDDFQDDVFQLSPTQQAAIWENETVNIDLLIDILVEQNPTVCVNMLGGFIGRRIFPIGYLPDSYRLGDQVLHLSVGNSLKVFRAITDNTIELPTNGDDWEEVEFDSLVSYQKGDFVSYNDVIYECLVDFTGTPTFPNEAGTTDWKTIASYHNLNSTYLPGDLVIGKDKDNVLHLFECLAKTKGSVLSDWKFWLGAPEVESDLRYVFDEFASNPWSPLEPEEINPPTAGSKKAMEFERVRYAQAQIFWNNESGELQIEIEAYASPLISRLDNVMSNNSKDVDLVDFHTLYGQNPVSSNYGRINHTSGPMPSYNQLLTALRTWGVLEGLAKAVKDRAALRGTAIETTINAKMDEILSGAFVTTTQKVSDPDIQNRSIHQSGSVSYPGFSQIKL